MFENLQVLSLPFLFSVNNNFYLLIPWDSQKIYSAFQLIYPWSLVIFPMQFEFSQSGLTLCELMDCSTPGLTVHNQLPFTPTYIHWVGDAIQTSHLLSTPFPRVFNPSQHQVNSGQFSSVVSDSATPWTAAHQASLSITNSRSYSNSCPLSQWCHPTISSSVVPFCSHLQSSPASGSLPRSQFFA